MIVDTMGLVQSLFCSTGGGCCTQIGPDPSNVELLTLVVSDTDDSAQTAAKVNIIAALGAAYASQQQVSLSHNDTDAFILSISTPFQF